MKISEALRFGSIELANNHIEAPAKQAGAILCHILNKDKLFLYVNNDYCLTTEELQKYKKNISKRSTGYPLQYIIGDQEFMSLKFKVNENVLIPRQDTEVLVENIIEIYNNKKTNINILEIGVGSGCISISLAKYIKNSEIIGVDISKEAIEVATYNLKLNNLNNVKFFQSNIFESIGSEYFNYFDCIVSNPPYISINEKSTLQREVLNEPHLALFAENNGLFFYEKIICEAKRYLKSDGMICFEIGYKQSKDIFEILMNQKFKNVRVVKDLSKNDRVIIGEN